MTAAERARHQATTTSRRHGQGATAAAAAAAASSSSLTNTTGNNTRGNENEEYEAEDEGEMRFSQLADERTHNVCTEANKKELLVTKLNRLRMLREDNAKDAWMFET